MKIGDKVKIIKVKYISKDEVQEYLGNTATITYVYNDGSYELDIDEGVWRWYADELELIDEKAFQYDTYCDLIGKYSEISMELGKQKRNSEIIIMEIDRLKMEKELLEDEMHMMLTEFEERCECIDR